MGICLSSENYYDHYFPKLSSVLQFSERLQMYDYALHLGQKPVLTPSQYLFGFL